MFVLASSLALRQGASECTSVGVAYSTSGCRRGWRVSVWPVRVAGAGGGSPHFDLMSSSFVPAAWFVVLP